MMVLVGAAPAVADQDVVGMIVKFRPPLVVSAQHLDEWVAMRGVELIREAEIAPSYRRAMSGGAHVISLGKVMGMAEAKAFASRLMALPDIEYAEPDAVINIAALTPNDPGYSQQWNMEDVLGGSLGTVNLPGAWAVTTGSSDIIVAVVDTGVLSHADLNANLIGGSAASSGRDFVSDASSAYSGMIGSVVGSNDGDGRDSDPTDPGDFSNAGVCGSGSMSSSWHGTHVAGVIAATGNNNVGIAGVNWNTRLLTSRAIGVCGGLLSDVVDAIRWSSGITVDGVQNPNPAHVINLSIGSDGSCGPAYQSAIDDAIAMGAVVVVAAGNSSGDAADSRPGNCHGVVTVTGVSRDGARAWYSDYDTGSSLDDVIALAAPGGDIRFAVQDGVLSTLDSGTTTARNDDIYGWYQGTSMAAPHVSGVAALMLAANENLRNRNVSDVPALIREKLIASARPFPVGTGSDCDSQRRCGAGILDATAAVLAVTTPPVAQISVSSTIPASSLVVLDGAGSYDDGVITSYAWAQVEGHPVVLSDSAASSPGFVAPSTSQSLRFVLSVTDDVGLRDSAEVNLYVVGPPAAPSGLTATPVGDSRVDLVWQDNSADETGFSVERKYSGSEFVPVASLPGNTTTYSDTGLSPSTTYEYRVLAHNGDFYSSPSETAVATTAAQGGSKSGGGGMDWMALAFFAAFVGFRRRRIYA